MKRIKKIQNKKSKSNYCVLEYIDFCVKYGLGDTKISNISKISNCVKILKAEKINKF